MRLRDLSLDDLQQELLYVWRRGSGPARVIRWSANRIYRLHCSLLLALIRRAD